MLAHICLLDVLCLKRSWKRFEISKTNRHVQPSVPHESSFELPRSLLVELDKSSSKEPTCPRCSQRVENKTNSSLPSIPQDLLQIQNEKAKIRALGRIHEPASYALPYGRWYRCHQWNLQEKLQLCRWTQVNHLE